VRAINGYVAQAEYQDSDEYQSRKALPFDDAFRGYMHTFIVNQLREFVNMIDLPGTPTFQSACRLENRRTQRGDCSGDFTR
jgi:hypothetical protein